MEGLRVIDRFGHRISVGWAEHELVWIEAALMLDRHERQAAFRDIAAMTVRTLAEVQYRAKQIKQQAKRQAQSAAQRRVMRLPAGWSLKSELRQPTREQLMAGRA